MTRTKKAFVPFNNLMIVICLSGICYFFTASGRYVVLMSEHSDKLIQDYLDYINWTGANDSRLFDQLNIPQSILQETLVELLRRIDDGVRGDKNTDDLEAVNIPTPAVPEAHLKPEYADGVRSYETTPHIQVNCKFASHHFHGTHTIDSVDSVVFLEFALFFISRYDKYETATQTSDTLNNFDLVLNKVLNLNLDEDAPIAARTVFMLRDSLMATTKFPGSFMNQANKYEPSDRKWYQKWRNSSSGPRNGLSNNLHYGEFIQSPVYLDFRPGVGLVRTLVAELEIDARKYLFCVDFVWRSAALAPSDGIQLVDVEMISEALDITTNIVAGIPGLLAFAIIFVPLVILRLKKISTLGYTRIVSQFGKGSIRFDRRDILSEIISIGWGLFVDLFGRGMRHSITSQQISQWESSVSSTEDIDIDCTKSINLRGVEIRGWVVTDYIIFDLWFVRMAWKRKETSFVSRIDYQTTSDPKLTHYEDLTRKIELIVLPETRPNLVAILPLMERIIHNANCKTQPAQQNPLVVGDRLPLPTQAVQIKHAGLRRYLNLGDDSSPQEVVSGRAIEQNRLDLHDSLEKLKVLWDGQNIATVMRAKNFEQFIERKMLSDIPRGSSNLYIILVEDETNWQRILCNHLETLMHATVEDQFPIDRMMIVFRKELTSELRMFDELEFILVDELTLIITSAISEKTQIDRDAGRVYVDGYISWREADVQFYKSIFTVLRETSKMTLDEELQRTRRELGTLCFEGNNGSKADDHRFHEESMPGIGVMNSAE